MNESVPSRCLKREAGGNSKRIMLFSVFTGGVGLTQSIHIFGGHTHGEIDKRAIGKNNGNNQVFQANDL
jgi:hypothetical protein